MQGMTVLARCRRAEDDKRRIRQRIERRRDAATSATARTDKVGGRAGGSTDKISGLAAEIADLERDLADRERALRTELGAACRLIDRLTEAAGQVVHGYYIQRLGTPAIAARLGYTEGYVRRLKTDGEREIRGIPEGDVARLLPEWYKNERPEGDDERNGRY